MAEEFPHLPFYGGAESLFGPYEELRDLSPEADIRAFVAVKLLKLESEMDRLNEAIDYLASERNCLEDELNCLMGCLTPL